MCCQGGNFQAVLRIRILFATLLRIRMRNLSFTLMRIQIRILASIINAQNLEKKCSNRLIFHTFILSCYLQIDADPDPDTAYYFDADPDPIIQFDADPDLHCFQV
jgi:hypothetical protein